MQHDKNKGNLQKLCKQDRKYSNYTVYIHLYVSTQRKYVLKSLLA